MKRPGQELENLLLQKSFEELNKEERSWVLAQIDQETYESMRWTLLESGSAFKRNKPKLDPIVQARLREKVKQQKSSPVAGAIFNYKVPAWYAFAAASVLFLLFSNFQSLNKQEPETIVITKVDTVYRDAEPQLVDSTAETLADTNIQIANKFYKRVNQSPSGKIRKPSTRTKKQDSIFVDLPNYEDALVSTYDTATLNSMINDYLEYPKERRRKNSDKHGLEAIQRVY